MKNEYKFIESDFGVGLYIIIDGRYVVAGLAIEFIPEEKRDRFANILTEKILDFVEYKKQEAISAHNNQIRKLLGIV